MTRLQSVTIYSCFESIYYFGLNEKHWQLKSNYMFSHIARTAGNTYFCLLFEAVNKACLYMAFLIHDAFDKQQICLHFIVELPFYPLWILESLLTQL